MSTLLMTASLNKQ